MFAIVGLLRDATELAVVAWIAVAVGAAGLLIGIRYRVPALLAATFLTIVAGAAGVSFLGFPEEGAVIATFFLVLILQGAYLLGLMLVRLWHLI